MFLSKKKQQFFRLPESTLVGQSKRLARDDKLHYFIGTEDTKYKKKENLPLVCTIP